MNLKQLFLGIVIFLGIYIVPMIIVSLLGVRGLQLLIVANLAVVAQVALTIVFFKRQQLTTGFVGLVVIMIQVVLYVIGNLTFAKPLVMR